MEKFVGILWALSYSIDIFDRDLAHNLQEMIGTKYLTLWRYYDLFYEVEEDRIARLNRVQIMEKASRNLFRFDEIKLDLPPTSDTYDLSNDDDLRRLRDESLKDIRFMEQIVNHLADFINSNCELRDFFPASVPADWVR